MKNKGLLILILALVIAAGAVVFLRGGAPEPDSRTNDMPVDHSHAHAPTTTTTPAVPAFQTAAEAQRLPKTLPASQFIGKAREAYLVAKEIPQTLAQLPCYCHCDQSFGHKSLHTCFVDDHAAHCAVCVDEALLAYRLQKEEKLTAEQVRAKIVEMYSATE
ncbi:MAG: CYCXC family (seleno)protein [Pyrinomonadaceae bacterium]